MTTVSVKPCWSHVNIKDQILNLCEVIFKTTAGDKKYTNSTPALGMVVL